MNHKSTVLFAYMVLMTMMAGVVLAKDKMNNVKDIMRKSIVYDTKTPDVFYCPIQKPSGFDKLIVRSKPLHKLCEYEGKELPADYKSDCYQDVDESSYACKEKYRIMKRMYPPGSEVPYNGTSRLMRYMDLDKPDKSKVTSKH